MNTYEVDLMGRRRRRRHSAEFKATVIPECLKPGVSMAAVALAHSLNANMLRKWVIDAEHKGVAPVVPAAEPKPELPRMLPPTFVPLALAAPAVGGHPDRIASLGHDDQGRLAGSGGPRLRGLAGRLATMIRVEAVWLCTVPVDMRAGTDTTLARVVQVFGSARPHHAYVFANGSPHVGCTRADSSGQAAAAAHHSRLRASNWMRWCWACPSNDSVRPE